MRPDLEFDVNGILDFLPVNNSPNPIIRGHAESGRLDEKSPYPQLMDKGFFKLLIIKGFVTIKITHTARICPVDNAALRLWQLYRALPSFDVALTRPTNGKLLGRYVLIDGRTGSRCRAI